MERPPITLAISSDLRGYPQNATLIASILRRTPQPVHVRFYCQGFTGDSFSTGRLRVEFLRTETVRAGNFPRHVGPAVFDRLQVMRDSTDWERCLVVDYDMLALCDLAPYFEEDFEGNLLMARLFGPGNTLGVQMAGRGGLPPALAHAADYPYFYMGPMMNLAAMRQDHTWEKLLAAHDALGQEEQMALTIATAGRVKAVGRQWNLVPQWDHLAKGPEGPEQSLYGTVGPAARWHQGVPEGIIHWTGGPKPWHSESPVWRADLWEAEETSWDALRQGWWEKPLAVDILPRDPADLSHLARRGWKVQAVRDLAQEIQPDPMPEPGVGQIRTISLAEELRLRPKPAELRFPDLEWRAAGDLPDDWPDLASAEMVRFGPGISPAAWLPGRPRPRCLVLQGPVTAATLTGLRQSGWSQEARISRDGWPAGGPAPEVLDFADASPAPAPEGVDVYLR